MIIARFKKKKKKDKRFRAQPWLDSSRRVGLAGEFPAKQKIRIRHGEAGSSAQSEDSVNDEGARCIARCG